MLMWAHFNSRRTYSSALPEILTGGTPENGSINDQLVWLKVLLGYTAKCPADLDNEKKWPALPDGVSRRMAGKELPRNLRKQMAKEAVEEWLTDELIEKSLDQIAEVYASDEERYTKLAVVFPTTHSEDFSDNYVPVAMAERISEYLNECMPNRHLPLEVSVQDGEIFAVSKASRGMPKHKAPESPREERYFWGVHRIAAQPWIRGEVEANAIYWLADDGTTVGTTVCNHLNHLNCHNAGVGAVTCLTKRFNGAEILKAQPESAEFLIAAMRQNLIDHETRDTVYIDGEVYVNDSLYRENPPALTSNMRELGTKLGGIGISLDMYGGFSSKIYSPRKVAATTSATNQELLLMGSYFMDVKHDHLWDLLDKALKATGSSLMEAKDSYPLKLAYSNPGHISEFCDLVDFAVCNSRHYTIQNNDVANEHWLEDRPEIPGKGSWTVSTTFSDVPFLHSLPCDHDWKVKLDSLPDSGKVYGTKASLAI